MRGEPGGVGGARVGQGSSKATYWGVCREGG